MRYAILLIPLIALLAPACDDDGTEPSATAPAGEVGGLDQPASRCRAGIPVVCSRHLVDRSQEGDLAL